METDVERDPLLRAIEQQDAESVRDLLLAEPILAHGRITLASGKTYSLLHRAMPGDGDPLLSERAEIVAALLQAGADPNALGWGDNQGICAPITIAAWGGHSAMIRLLIAHGADPNGLSQETGKPYQPIEAAARHGHRDAVETLIDAGATYSFSHLLQVDLTERLTAQLAATPTLARQPFADGSFPLHLCMHSSASRSIAILLLDAGAEIEDRDHAGRTALHVAIETGQWETAQFLVDRGARQDIFTAIAFQEIDSVKALLSQDPQSANAMQTDGTTPLFYAVYVGSVECVQLLLDAGADVSPQAKRIWACLTPLHLALQNRRTDILEMLLAYDADVNAFAVTPGEYWPTPLHCAARWGTLAQVRRLLDAGADPNGGGPVPDSMDASVLAWATFTQNTELIALLREYGLKFS